MTGTFTDIVEIVAPSSAVAGSRVDVEVKIKNLHSSTIDIMVMATLLYTTIEFLFDTASVRPGETYTFPGWFTMPSRSEEMHAYSYWRDAEGYWHQDDEKTKIITLPEEAYAGTIIGIELEHDEAQEGLPVYDIPQGERGLVHVWGRNDMATTQALGIDWVVRDPDGIVVEHYWDWSYGHGPGDDHEFIGGRFDLDKPGTYTISVGLSMNIADPEIVDSYYGNLCTVAAAVPEPEFRGFGVSEYVKV